ncbi:MAG: substrate-binding domain-containing protein [Victivallaceae bacterium]|jgi:DNA-binding LacI/PurR family transcriptional regulator
MDTKTYKFKYEEVADKLREMIMSGEINGDLMPKEEDILRHFNVSRKTILRVMDLLVKEGLLTRVKGTGTFINRDSSVNTTDLMHRMIVIIMATEGHYYGKLSASVRQHIQERDLFPISYNINFGTFGTLTKAASLNALLNSPIKGLLLHGAGYFRNPVLANRPGLRSVFIDFYDYDGVPPWGAVFVDYEHGAYLAARHLLESGRRKLMLVTHKPPDEVSSSPSHQANHHQWQLDAGCRRAVEEFPGASCRWIKCSPLDEDFDLIASGIIGAKPEGIICNYDYLAAKLCSFSLRAGVKVPEDIAFIGCYNTPWTQEAEIPLTSIDVLPVKLGEMAVDLLLSGRNEIIKLKPVLRIRRSSDSASKEQKVSNINKSAYAESLYAALN